MFWSKVFIAGLCDQAGGLGFAVEPEKWKIEFEILPAQQPNRDNQRDQRDQEWNPKGVTF